MNTTNNTQIQPHDARPGDRFTFIAAETGTHFRGLILARELSLVQVRWTDGHESWTPLEVSEGKVEVYRDGKPSNIDVAVAAPGTNHQEPSAQIWQ